MELLDIMLNRRSVRTYTGEHIPGEKLEKILQAGLSAPSGRSKKPWELILVQKKETLEKLSDCREHGSQMLKDADCAIVVVADEQEQDVWTEDCSIVMAYMHLMADSLGVGSCWIQGRLRQAFDGRSTEEYIREVLGFPNTYRLEAILSLGIPQNKPVRRRADQLPMEKVHLEKF